MKKYSILSIGVLFLMLTIGGIAYGQGGMGDSSSQSGGSSMGQSSSDQSGMGQSGTSGMGQPSDQSGMGKSGTSGTGSMSQAQVDINTASAKELESVPGMSSSMAKNIVKYRDQNGPFTSVDDLTKVKGINEKKLNAMRHGLTVGPAGGAAPMGGSQQGTGGMSPESSGAGGTGGMGSGSSSGSSGTSGTGTSGSGSSSGSSGY
jgi:comEA protein